MSSGEREQGRFFPGFQREFRLRESPCVAAPAAYNSEIVRVEAARPGVVTCVPHGGNAAGVAQLVEHDVANVVVVGSNPITRSWHFGAGQAKLSEYRKICLPHGKRLI